MKKRKSIHDFASDMKISIATISFVLSGEAREKRISRTMEERVLKYAKETGFQPSAIAQTLRTGKSRMIGVLIEDISDPFFSAIFRVIEREANNVGYNISFFSTDNNTEKTKGLLKVLKDRQVDGYIIAPPLGITIPDGLAVVGFDDNSLFELFTPAVTAHNQSKTFPEQFSNILWIA